MTTPEKGDNSVLIKSGQKISRFVRENENESALKSETFTYNCTCNNANNEAFL